MEVTCDSSLVTVDGELLALALPAPSEVMAGVAYGPSGTEFTGTMTAGSGTYPTPAEISTAVLAALNATTIPVNVKQVNGVTLAGRGITGDSMRPA